MPYALRQDDYVQSARSIIEVIYGTTLPDTSCPKQVQKDLFKKSCENESRFLLQHSGGDILLNAPKQLIIWGYY